MQLSTKAVFRAKRIVAIRSRDIEAQSRFNQAMADPTRLKILVLLRTFKELCPGDIAKVLNITPSAVSHQMRTLEHLSLVKKVRMGKMICYSLKARLKNLF